MSLSDALAGFGAGVINDTVLYIPDSMKYLRQNNAALRPVNFQTIPWWFRGGIPIILGGGLSYSTYFYCYGLSKAFIDPAIKKNENSLLNTLILSGLAGSLAIIPATLVSFPFDTLKKHTSLLSDMTPAQVTRKIYQEGGFKGFYFGMNYTISRDIYMSALKMAIFEGVSKFCATNRDSNPNYPQWLRQGDISSSPMTKTSSSLESSVLTGKEIALVGLISGCLTSVLSMPMDCIVSRLRSPLTPPELKKSWLICAKWMIEQDKSSIKPFFRGTTIRTVNYAIGSTVFWTLFSTFHKGVEGFTSSAPKD